GESEVCPEIVPFAENALRAAAGDRARTGGFVVNTTIDPILQAQARTALRDGLDNYAKRHGLEPPLVDQKRSAWGDPFVGAPRVNGIYVGVVKAVDDASNSIDVAVGSKVGTVLLGHEQRYNPHHLPPSQFTRIGAVLRVGVLDDSAADGNIALRLELGPQAALIALDVRTREVLALVGGYDGVAGGLDRATQTKRQPGSTFKPITYSYALHSHLITPATVLHVRHEHDKEGPIGVRVRQALAESNNRAAEFVFKESGAKQVVDWAHQLGVESKLGADKSLALGSYEVSVLELANAYATFASGGDALSPVMIRSVQGVEGALPLPPVAPRRQVMTVDEAYMITSLLRSVVQEGTGMGAQRVGRPVAGKTGTTNRVKDAWFIGYSTEIVAAVWVGYDDALPLGRGEQGSATALPMWVNFMKQAHEHRPATEFPRPAGVIEVSIDPRTGLLPYPGEQGLIQEEFLDGTVPTQAAVPDAGAAKVRQDPPDGGAPVRGGIDPHP
ncbi:MAG TPA: penicillin-binding transpeptidase domain-containing protein, partial [Polyangiaceae bacterium]|nr:penicillin-binding transpeptidase domain-containing protein [Polyangiaceae bacterium]